MKFQVEGESSGRSVFQILNSILILLIFEFNFYFFVFFFFSEDVHVGHWKSGQGKPLSSKKINKTAVPSELGIKKQKVSLLAPFFSSGLQK